MNKSTFCNILIKDGISEQESQKQFNKAVVHGFGNKWSIFTVVTFFIVYILLPIETKNFNLGFLDFSNGYFALSFILYFIVSLKLRDHKLKHYLRDGMK